LRLLETITAFVRMVMSLWLSYEEEEEEEEKKKKKKKKTRQANIRFPRKN
jgi:hypothetical protein